MFGGFSVMLEVVTMRPIIKLAMAVATAIGLAGCVDFTGVDDAHGGVVGSGLIRSESRSVHGIDGVSLSGVGRLVIQQGASESLVVIAEDNIIPLIESDVVRGRLLLGLVSGPPIQPRREIVYQLTVLDIDAVEVSGAGRVELVDFESDFLEVLISGAGLVEGGGTVPEQEVVVSGAGAYLGGDIMGRVVSVNVSGAGRALVRASERLHANVSGIGLVEYLGDPAVYATISGLGHVRRVY
jgi:hypothetical protein